MNRTLRELRRLKFTTMVPLTVQGLVRTRDRFALRVRAHEHSGRERFIRICPCVRLFVTKNSLSGHTLALTSLATRRCRRTG